MKKMLLSVILYKRLLFTSLREKPLFWPRFLCTSYKGSKIEKAVNWKMISNVRGRKNLIQAYIETVDIDESL